MKQSDNRILTTHVGSLPRPHDLLDMMKAKLSGQAYDQNALEKRVRSAVADIVKKQVDCGIDVVADGEQSKPGFFSYVRERLDGFEPRPGRKFNMFAAEVAQFPEYYAQYFKEAMLGGTVTPFVPLVCTGPVKYRDLEPLKRDIENLKAAVASAKATSAFMPAIAPSGVGMNEYYKNDEEYFHAVAQAMRTEYKAIVDAGLTLQVDDPFLCDMLIDPKLTAKQKRDTAWMYVEVINEGLKGIPPEKVRFHTCYSINEGPRVNDAPMSEVARYMLKINAGAYSFEYGNPRHEHEYHVWEELKLPDGKKLIPGMIMHAFNIVEHPELIAERLVRFANAGGPRQRHGRRRLRLFVAGLVQARGASDGHVGKIRSHARGRGPGVETAVEEACGKGEIRKGPEEKMNKAIGCLLAGVFSLSAHAADKLTIGFMTTLSGPASIIGYEIRDGMRIALDQLDNRVGGLPTTVLIEDDRQKPDAALDIATKFVKQNRVDVIMGLSFSNLLLAIYGPIIQSETVLISSNPGPSQIAGKDCSKYFFSTSWQGDSYAEAMGAYLTKKGVQNVYLMAPNYAAGKDVLAGFKRFYKGSIAGEVYTSLSQLDFASELAQLRAANPSAVFAFYPGGLGINFVKQYSQAGLKDKIPLYTSYTLDNTTLRGIGEDAVGLLRTSFWDEDSANPVNKRFVADFEAKFGRTPADYAAQAYDTIMLLDSAVREVKGRIEDKPAFLAALKKANFKSMRGNFRFNNNNFPIQDYYLGRIVKDGTKLRVKTEEVVLKDHGDAYAAQCPMK